MGYARAQRGRRWTANGRATLEIGQHRRCGCWQLVPVARASSARSGVCWHGQLHRFLSLLYRGALTELSIHVRDSPAALAKALATSVGQHRLCTRRNHVRNESGIGQGEPCGRPFGILMPFMRLCRRTAAITRAIAGTVGGSIGPMMDRLYRWLTSMVIDRESIAHEGACMIKPTLTDLAEAVRPLSAADSKPHESQGMPMPSPAVHTAHRWRKLEEQR
jgi:hypothetical protein